MVCWYKWYKDLNPTLPQKNENEWEQIMMAVLSNHPKKTGLILFKINDTSLHLNLYLFSGSSLFIALCGTSLSDVIRESRVNLAALHLSQSVYHRAALCNISWPLSADRTFPGRAAGVTLALLARLQGPTPLSMPPPPLSITLLLSPV